jgi:hypothetical protein
MQKSPRQLADSLFQQLQTNPSLWDAQHLRDSQVELGFTYLVEDVSTVMFPTVEVRGFAKVEFDVDDSINILLYDEIGYVPLQAIQYHKGEEVAFFRNGPNDSLTKGKVKPF